MRSQSSIIQKRQWVGKLWGLLTLIMVFISSCNALEYFFAGKNYLQVRSGVIEKYEQKYSYGLRSRLYSKSIIWLKGIDKRFYLKDRTADGGSVDAKEGDTVTLYIRRWYQDLYNYRFASNIYYAEKNGTELYNNLQQWKVPAFAYMCIFAACAFFFFAIYLDVAKNITISVWFQKRFLNKQKRGAK